MRKKKRKNIKQNNTSNQKDLTNIIISSDLLDDRMIHIIAKAIVEAEEIKLQKDKEKKNNELAEWRKKIGYKEYESKFKRFLNEIYVILKISFLPKKDIEGYRASTVLLKTLLAVFFKLMEWCLLLFAILLLLSIPIQYMIEGIEPFPIAYYMLSILWSVFLLFFSRVFRMASEEVDKIDDRNYIFSLFTSITSVISIIIAVIAITKGS